MWMHQVEPKIADKSQYLLHIRKAFRNFVLSSQQSRGFSQAPPCWRLWLVRLWLCPVWYRESRAPRSRGFTMDFLSGSKTQPPSGSRRPSLMIRALTHVWPQTALARRPPRSSWTSWVNPGIFLLNISKGFHKLHTCSAWTVTVFVPPTCGDSVQMVWKRSKISHLCQAGSLEPFLKLP